MSVRMADTDSVLNLAFAHGLSPIRSCVVNLSNKSGERLFFVSSNTAVIQVRTQDCGLFARRISLSETL